MKGRPSTFPLARAQALRQMDYSIPQIAKELKCARSTVSYHLGERFGTGQMGRPTVDARLLKIVTDDDNAVTLSIRAGISEKTAQRFLDDKRHGKLKISQARAPKEVNPLD